jgi:adenylate cyclase
MDRMATLSRERFTTFLRGISLRQVRLVTGIILFAYVVSHFINHALGNISLDALEAGVVIHTLFWQFLPVTIVFYAACIVHTGLGIWALYERRQFRWRAIEPLQLALGLSIPMLIVSHIIGIRLGQTLYGHEKMYPQVLFLYWIWAPWRIWMMLLVMTVAWVHGCIGLYFWLRMRPFFKRAAPYLLAAAVLIPTLSMLGFYQSGRMVKEIDSNEWRAETQSPQQIGTRAEAQTLERITDIFLLGYFGLIGIALAARGARAINERRRGMINLSYGNGRIVRVPRGLSVLEASLRYNVPHASVCGGRARCSTCRIRIIGDHSDLPEPSQLQSDARWAGALSGQPVRRHARLDATGGEAAAVRHRVHRQPLPRRGLAGGARERRHAEPVRRRRHAGTVRPLDQPAASLPAGAARGGHDRRECRCAEQISRT